MPDTLHSALLILVIAAVTALLRFLPFVLFPEGKPTPKAIVSLSGMLPCAIMGMLVVYCLKGIDFTAASHALPELLSIGFIVGVHLWKRNTALSIFAGTACYMLLLRLLP